MIEATAALRTALEATATAPVHPAATAMASHLAERFGTGVRGVLFYGSCLRQGTGAVDLEGSVLDFYVLPTAYTTIYGSRLAALANRLLPPNVFFVELPWQGHVIRAKVAVVSLSQFRERVRADALHPTFWARFAQPAAIVFAADAGAHALMLDALVDAVRTFCARTAALLDRPTDPVGFWTTGLRATFRAELRSEFEDRARELAEANRAHCERLTLPALRSTGLAVEEDASGLLGVSLSERARAKAMRRWRLAWTLGKPLSVLRLAKGAFTFEGGVDYVLYKIERHTGRRPNLTPFERRHPVLCAPLLLWKVRRQALVR